MTEQEFVAWCDEDMRAEWVDGEVVMMSPASNEHDGLIGWLVAVLRPLVEQDGLGLVRRPFGFGRTPARKCSMRCGNWG